MSNVGYAIRRTLKKSVALQYAEQARATGHRYISPLPGYLLPGEGYGAALKKRGDHIPEDLHLGWPSREEAEQALAVSEQQAIEHGYEVNWAEHDYQIVRVTVTEEEVLPPAASLALGKR